METEMTPREEAIQNILDRCADIRQTAEELQEQIQEQLNKLNAEQ